MIKDKGYWQIPVSPDDVFKTAFVTPDGQYEIFTDAIWNGELRRYSSPRTEESFRGISGVGSYIDDIVLYNDSWEEHLRTLKELLERRVRITAHPMKCLLGEDRMEFLGDRIRCEVITPRKVCKTPHRTNKKQVRATESLYLSHITHNVTILGMLQLQYKSIFDCLLPSCDINR